MLKSPVLLKSYCGVFLEETDKPLPEKIDPRTCLTFSSAVALLDKSHIKSCKDLHLSGFVRNKTLVLEFAADEIER